jgi:hypothetical protein
LATLGDATQIGSFLFIVAPPKVAKPSANVSMSLALSLALLPTNVANVNEPL